MSFYYQLIFDNLVNHAIKFQRHLPHASFLTVNIYVKANDLYLVFVDNGHSVSEDHLHEIFEPFRCLNESDLSNNGVGLYIAKQAVEKLNGEIAAYTNEYNGMSFTIRIPIKKPDV